MPVFVWTKIGAEAGESVSDIIARKESERTAGGGTFWWGVGTSLGPALRVEAQCARGTIPILFCEMLGRPQRHDVSPASTVRWARWRDWKTSCHSQSKIEINRSGQQFDPRNCRTVPGGKIPGDSQNTAHRDGDFRQSHPNGRYRIAFVANLVSPWQATLTR